MVCESSVAQQVVDVAARFALDHHPLPPLECRVGGVPGGLVTLPF